MNKLTTTIFGTIIVLTFIISIMNALVERQHGNLLEKASEVLKQHREELNNLGSDRRCPIRVYVDVPYILGGLAIDSPTNLPVSYHINTGWLIATNIEGVPPFKIIFGIEPTNAFKWTEWGSK